GLVRFRPVNGVRITGLGAVTALGDGVERLWAGALRGEVALRPTRRLLLPELAELPLGEVDMDSPAGADRAFELGLRAAREAIADAAWPDHALRDEGTALLVATTKGGVQLAQHVLEGRARPEALHDSPLFAVGAKLARALGVRGPVQLVSVACASGTTAVGMG